ncbi:hypothetical protein PPNSA23_40260 [Phyllobacterium phragmitis]|uniref:Uncharacterized protein n=1 Tax=Phyllobacterium phragmitis TaxID=2670329 RepID=A0ABQ0H5A2_9HYPH
MTSNVEQFPRGPGRLTEFEALVAAGPTALDAVPGAVYICDREGWLVRYNSEAPKTISAATSQNSMSTRL